MANRDWIMVSIDAETMARVERYRAQLREAIGLDASRSAVVHALLRQALERVGVTDASE